MSRPMYVHENYRQGKSGKFNICPNCDAVWEFPKNATINISVNKYVNITDFYLGDEDSADGLCIKCYESVVPDEVKNCRVCNSARTGVCNFCRKKGLGSENWNWTHSEILKEVKE